MVKSLDVNSQNFMVVWLDFDAFKTNYCVEHKQLLHTKVKSIKIFDDTNQCIDFITNNQDKSVLLFVSGVLCTPEFDEKIDKFINVEEVHGTKSTQEGFERCSNYQTQAKFERQWIRKRRRFQGVYCRGFSASISGSLIH